ncbi:MAG: hypothetical protein JST18_13975 [Bacteroidetes bacterium]|nr:hypothetical protein [Bacteroidota bacterium]
MKILFTFLALIILGASAHAQQNDFDKSKMKVYYMVFLKKGPHRDQDSVTAAKIQEGHIAHLTKLAGEGKIDLNGPFMDDGEIRGISVYNVASAEEAIKLASEDPAVKSGRLIVEVHPWYSWQGSSLK